MAVAPDVSAEELALMAVDEAAARAMVQSNEAEARAMVQSRLNDPSVSLVVAIVHSEGPAHYTLLVRSRIAVGVYELRYYDSLRGPSASARAKAQTFADQCGWECPVPAPGNGRFQQDEWSCGLWCLQFAEEAVRQCRGEPFVVPVVSVSDILSRVNKWISTVAAERPEVVDEALKAVLESLDKGSEKAKSQPVASGSVVDLSLPPVPPSGVPPVEPEPPVKGAKNTKASQEALSSALAAVLAGLDHCSSAPAPASAAPAPASAAPALASAAPAPASAAPASAAPAPASAAPAPASPNRLVEEFTVEMAEIAKSRCSKCRFQGCAQCMKQFHVPRRLFRQWSKESGGSEGSAKQ